MTATGTILEGMIPLIPDIMILEWEGSENSTECLCSDIQRDDYSPFFEWANYLTIILALPILSIFGVLTNIINVFLYTRKRLQNSANTYLLFLACSDFMVIVTGLFIFWIDSARSYIPELTQAPYTTVYTLPFGYMAQTCSIYFTVAAAVDCFVNVCWASHSKHYCTVRRAKQICISIVVVSIMYNSLRFPQFNLRKCFNDITNEQVIEICPTSLFVTINSVYNIYMYMVLMTLLPFFFLLCINAIIVKRQSKAKTDEAAPKNEGTSDDTITMIMVVILFLACNTLALVVNFIENFTEPSPVLLNFLSDTSNFLVVFNSSVNCIIYFIFNQDYRNVFKIYWKKLKRVLYDEYCCCVSSGRRNYAAYQPVSTRLTIDKNLNGTSTTKLILPSFDLNRSDQASFAESESTSSPIWQPLTTRNLPNVDWPNIDDDVDSGWDDGSQISSRTPKRWLAEVNIVDMESSEGRHPRIYVRPLNQLPNNNETISITAL
uniref:G_PROTEIN_RECEP_F1_2 domain-containing protein n=2 Tax=Caenorhabditis japonica TaxID=281687 RepID=A0A8R1HSA1_CAEJA